MAMTRDQALAFAEVMTKNPKVQAHLAAVLGRGRSPKIDDFDSRDEEACGRCGELIGYLEEVFGVLREIQATRERQKSIDLAGDEPKPYRRMRKAPAKVEEIG